MASSGTHAKMARTLGLTGLWDRFDGRIFSATEVERGKPAPDLFLFAAAAMGVGRDRCVVVEDSRSGIEAARAAGMRSVGYAGGLTPADWLQGDRTVVIDDMAELAAAARRRRKMNPVNGAPGLVAGPRTQPCRRTRQIRPVLQLTAAECGRLRCRPPVADQAGGTDCCVSIMSAMTARMNSSASSVTPPLTPP